MNSKAIPRIASTGLAVALALGAVGTLQAQTSNTLVTFSVDLSEQVAEGTFLPGTDTVAARGTFNSYGQFFLTNNPAGANPYLYSGTVLNTNDANGGKMQYKFWNSDPLTGNTGWETTLSSKDRCAYLPSTSGASLVLPTSFFNDAGPGETNLVTFQVDMAQQINVGGFHPATDTLDVRGTFNNWTGGLNVMTNDPSIATTNQFGLVTHDVYVTTAEITNSPGAAEAFKFVIQPSNWESPNALNSDGGGNRFFANVTGTLPIVYFNDATYAPVATVNVRFQVDMTAQVMAGNFDPNSGFVQVKGGFTGWDTSPVTCTNDPAGTNVNLFTAVVPITDGVGVVEQYKFWATVSANNGWEVGNNRTFALPQATSLVLPSVFFSDTAPADLLPADTLVTFSVSMTNAMGTDGHPFDPVNDVVVLNGPPNGNFAAWNIGLPIMTNNPVGSGIYSIDLLVPKGNPVIQTYKYGINGLDDEAPVNSNHVRYIRTIGTYVMPLDTFGNQLVEPSFGNLVAAPSTAGHVMVSWLGRPGVHLQTSTSLGTGTWQDHPETDGLSSTNWPAGSENLFFRLIKP